MILNNNNEYQKLKKCIISKPLNYSIAEPINKLQEKNIGNINKSKSLYQHNELVNILLNNEVDIEFMKTIKDKNYQVFTRDIGFVIFDTLFICKMSKNIRKEEVNELKHFSNRNNLKIHIMSNYIEGGDVFVHNNNILIGISTRTSERALDEISKVIPKSYNLISVKFNTDMLHLDCVFNVINKTTCIYSDDYILNSSALDLFQKKIKIPKNVVDELGTNYFVLSENTVIVTHEYMKKLLKNYFENIIYIDYSEFIKGGGSVRCSILPLERI
jgi:N-dimethylarginine dimethylaminohydrolase